MIQFNKYIFIISFLFTIKLTAQNDIMSLQNGIKFARYLNTTMQYEFAAQEFERLHFLYPKDSVVIYNLAKTYRLDNKCNKLQHSLELLAIDDRVFNYCLFTKEYLNFALECQQFKRFNDYLSFLKNQDDKDYYTLAKYWMTSDYDKVKSFPFPNKTLADSPYKNLLLLTRDFKKEKYKSPGLALAMSAIIPGSGKAYVHRWGDAFVSFMFVASNAFISYRAFHKKGIKSTNGWIFGGLGFSFYLGNLWGSYKAVKKYNNHINHSYQHNAENIIFSNF